MLKSAHLVPMKIDWIGWTPEGAVEYLDQTLLPKQEAYREAHTIEDMIEAIQALRVRGAPLIGISAAMGLAVAAAEEKPLTQEWFEDAVQRLGAARPTAVNLVWALDRMSRVADSAFQNGRGGESVVAALRSEAQGIWDEDTAMCRAIGEAGAALLSAGTTVMTHCNAGALATGGIGTALAPIYVAHEQGKMVDVVSCETRPLRQGARLTSWELSKHGVPVTCVVDGAAGAVMAMGKIDLVITGADRIAANGDSANKIGTYGLAVLAKAHNIPFYIAAPRSTIDLSTASGDAIPIEERSALEVDAAPGAQVFNPAFDVTPASYIKGIITDRGIIAPPYTKSIAALFS
jgi:methylthioribose-1-phosphate isomerase